MLALTTPRFAGLSAWTRRAARVSGARLPSAQRLPRAATLALVALASVPLANAGAVPWVLPAQPLSPAGLEAIGSDIAAMNDGAGMSVYLAASGNESFRVRARRVEAGGAIGPERPVSPAGVAVGAASVAAAPGGGAVAAWAVDADDQEGVRAARLTPDGTPGGILSASDVGEVVFGPEVAVGPDGRITVAWIDEVGNGGGERRVRARQFTADGFAGQLFEVSPARPNNRQPRVVVAPDGTATVAWIDGFGADEGIFIRRITPAGTLSPQILRVDDQSASNPLPGTSGSLTPQDVDLAIAPDGRVHVAFSGENSGGSRTFHQSFSVAGVPGPLVNLASGVPNFDAAVDTSEVRLAVRADGAALALWTSKPRPPAAGGQQIVGRRVTPAGTLGAPLFLTLPVDGAFDPRLVAAPDGSVVAIWRQAQGLFPPVFRADARRIGAGDQLGPVTTVSPDGRNVGDETLAIAAALDGRLMATWADFDGAGQNGRVRVVQSAPTLLPPPAPPTAPAPPPPLVLAPTSPAPPVRIRLSAMRVNPASVRRGRLAQTTRLLRVRATLNRSARLRVVFERRLPGLRRGNRCVAPTPALRRARARACVRFVGARAIARNGRAGVNTFTITRLVVAGRPLPVGRYRVSAVASAAGVPTVRTSRPLLVRPAPAPRR
jgi:hypothetical protein